MLNMLMQLEWISLHYNEVDGGLPDTWSNLTNVSHTFRRLMMLVHMVAACNPTRTSVAQTSDMAAKV